MITSKHKLQVPAKERYKLLPKWLISGTHKFHSLAALHMNVYLHVCVSALKCYSKDTGTKVSNCV